jgi:hypothetical protein
MEVACLLLEHAKAAFDSDEEYMQASMCGARRAFGPAHCAVC